MLRTGTRAVLRVEGELDYATRPILSRALDQALVTPPQSVVIEAHDLVFADVAGLAPILELAERMGPGAIQLHGAPRQVMRVLQLLRLDDMLA